MPDLHVRKQLRDAIAASLETISGLEQRIWRNRRHPFTEPQKDYPAVVIRFEGEPTEKATKVQGVQKRHIENAVYVFGRALGNDDIDDVMDDLCLKVEKQMFADPTFGKIAAETVLVDSLPMSGAELDGTIGVIRMSFVSVVLTKEGLPHKAF